MCYARAFYSFYVKKKYVPETVTYTHVIYEITCPAIIKKNFANLSICCVAHFNSISPVYCNYKCINSVVVDYTKDSFSF